MLSFSSSVEELCSLFCARHIRGPPCISRLAFLFSRCLIYKVQTRSVHPFGLHSSLFPYGFVSSVVGIIFYHNSCRLVNYFFLLFRKFFSRVFLGFFYRPLKRAILIYHLYLPLSISFFSFFVIFSFLSIFYISGAFLYICLGHFYIHYI